MARNNKNKNVGAVVEAEVVSPESVEETTSNEVEAESNEEVEAEVETDVEPKTEELKKKSVNRPIKVKADAKKLTVTLPNGVQRVYTAFTHGKVYVDLAKNFAEANGGEIEVE